jgi:sec-independent protein translocase protein TatA
MMALFGPGGYEWIIILIVALLLFGRRLPEVMKSMGQGVRMFKKGLQDVEDEVNSSVEDEPNGPRQLSEGEEDGENPSPND